MEYLHEVFGLLLDFDVAVAQHPEEPDTANLEAGEQVVEEQAHDILVLEKPRLLAGQANEPVDLAEKVQRALRLNPRLGMKGKGWAGSMAIGVRTG